MKLFKETYNHTALMQFTSVLVLIAVILCIAPQQHAIAQGVDIPDATLHGIIANELGLEAMDANGVPTVITQAEILNLTSLTAANQSIRSLQGLEAATNLTLLSLNNAGISDISALANLTNLQNLHLANNAISDISALRNLTSLRTLDLGSNQISDISVLADLGWTDEVQLEYLHLGDNRISNISALAELIFLQDLNLEQNAISDLSALANVQRLQGLWLSDNQISDISTLSKMHILVSLYLDNNQIANVSSLRGLNWLKILHLSNNQIVDISPLADLTRLTDLVLSANEIADFSTIATLVENLDFYENHSQRVILPTVNIPDAALAGAIAQALGKTSDEGTFLLSDMERLTTLRASGAGIADLTGLETAINLTQLELHNNAIVDVSPLANLTQLRALSLSDNQIVDVSPLQNLTALQLLSVQHNRIADLSPLDGLSPIWYSATPQFIPAVIPDAGLHGAIAEAVGKTSGAPLYQSDLASLTVLRAGEAGIVDLTGLEMATRLIHLELHDNAIVDISPLTHLTELQRLSLQRNQITDASPLANLTGLQLLFIEHNHIADLSPLDGLNPILYRTTPQYGPPIDIPDVGLRGAIEQALGKAAGEAIRQTDLESLTTLRANGSGVVALTGLDVAINLTQLELHNNAIVDLSPLANLTGLTVLTLNGNQIVDVSALANLTNLQALNLQANQIADVSSLANLTGLKWLFLGNNQIADLSPLDDLNLLLFAKDPQHVVSPTVVISDAGLQGAIEQALGKTTGDVTEADMASLGTLSATSASIADLTGLETAINLTRLDLQDNAIVDVSPLTDLTNLRALNLQANQIVDVSPLANLTNLSELDLANNRITDFSPLDGLVGQLARYSNTPQDTDAADATQEGDAPAESDGTPAEETEEEDPIPRDIADLLGLKPRPSGDDDPVVPGEVWPRCDDENVKPGEPCLEPPPDPKAPQFGIDINGDGIIDAQERLAAMPERVPERMALLANYPNPFNPETWIPYELSKSVEVTVSIYATNGHLVRALDLGHQDAGIYRSKSRAAYWDGCNAFGEKVASGVYFYVLTAGDFAATRKMLILK